MFCVAAGRILRRVYLRRNRRTVDGETYECWTLVESRRTARGPRQHTIATLGKLPGLDHSVQRGWEDIEALLEGRTPSPRQGELPGFASAAPGAVAPCWRQVDVRGTRVERVREFGEVYLALALWRRLGLHTVLRELLGTGREAVPWETVACLLTVARFCGQLSELGVAGRWFQRTALDELPGVDWRQVNDDRLYRGLDEFLLYDVTSTYFEGQAKGNALAARGYSRDNRVDVATVEQIVTAMEGKYGQAERIWVLDRGMVSEDNLAFFCVRAKPPASWARPRRSCGSPRRRCWRKKTGSRCAPTWGSSSCRILTARAASSSCCAAATRAGRRERRCPSGRPSDCSRSW